MIDRDAVKIDGTRMVAYEISGASDGFPVFLLHGTPGSKIGPKPRNIVLYRLGIRLICYDRPGYGGSDRQPNRSVADAAADVAAIAEHLKINEFGVIGRSGGGPHALACAALLPNNVVRTSVLVGIAPAGVPDLDWTAGMNVENVREYAVADSDIDELVLRLGLRADDVRLDPDSLVKFLEPQMSPSDRKIVGDFSIRRMLHDNYREALQGGAEGWVDDALAFRKDWGFSLSSIRTPVRVWHGTEDTFSPVSHARWLERQIQDAEVEIQPGAAHFTAVEILAKMLPWLSDARSLSRT